MVKLTTLSKAISITPRKTIFNRRLLIILVFLLTLCPLGAESWRYSILGENEEYMALVDSVISLMPYVDNQDVLSAVSERIENNERIKRDKKKAVNYEKEDYSSIPLPSISLPDTLEIERVDLSFPQFDSLLSSSDKDAYEYLIAQNNLDALIYIKSSGEGTIKDIEVLYNGNVIRKAYYTTSLYSYEEEALVTYFTSLLLSPSHNWHRINLDVPSFSLTIDGKAKADSSSIVILKNGLHNVSISSTGYVDKTEVIETGDERDINLSLSPLDSHSLYISTVPWNVEMKVNGEKLEGKYIPSLYSPYTLSLSSPSFSHLTFQSNRRDESVEVVLNPLWTEDNEIIEEKKNDFYRSIFTSLLSFGGFTAMRAVENIEGNGSNTLKVVFGGISIVSLINLVCTAIDYYSSASQGV